MADNTDITGYYARRAAEYEKVYSKPERQQELTALRQLLPGWFAYRSVLEVACGTGYWTECISATAESITATDISREVLDMAGGKSYACPVRFCLADAYVLDGVGGGYASGLAAFWWSHVPIRRREAFLRAFHARLAPGAMVVLLENRYVHGSNNPLSPDTDEDGNTFSLRRLDDGSEWKVLKNYPTENEVRGDIAPFASDIEYCAMQYYWWVRYFTV